MNSAYRRTFLAAVFQVVITIPAAGSAFTQAEPGARVRITTEHPSKHPEIGTLISADADSLRFTSATGTAVAIPTTSVTRLEYSRGRRSNAGHGAAIGGLIGAGTGLFLGILASRDDDNFYEIGPEEIAGVTALLGAVGAGLGGIIGATSHRERWELVPIPGRVGNEVLRGRRPIRAGLMIPF